jgi:magnesium transporter
VEEPPRWESVSWGETTWTDVTNPSTKETDLLGKKYSFHQLNLEDCLSKRQLTKVEDHESYIFALLHFPSLVRERIVVQNQLSIFLGNGFVVSLHGMDLALLSEMEQAAKNDESLQSDWMRSPAHLAYRIIDKLVDGIFPLLDRIREELDAIEDEVFDGRVSSAGSINRLRREIADLRRIISPLRRSVADLAARISKFTEENLDLYFSDVKDHIEKVWETLEEMKETIEIYKDSDFILSTEKTNRVLSVLTIVFTFSIPVTIVASIYGMNVPLPGGIGEGPPTALGPFTSFIILIFAMLVPALLMAWYFRRSGWLWTPDSS